MGCCSLASSLYIVGWLKAIWRRFWFPISRPHQGVRVPPRHHSEMKIASKSSLMTPECTKMTQGSNNYTPLFFLIRTSKFWPSLIVLKFLHNLNLNWRYERSSRLIRNLSNCEREAWKNSGFSRIRTRDLCDTGAVLYQLSYEAITVGSRSILVGPSCH